MRSATSKTSTRLWLMTTTAVPAPLEAWMKSSTWRVWATPSAAVGSSSITASGSPSSERAMATIWRCPPESEATASSRWGSAPRGADQLARVLLHLDVVDRPEPPQRPRVVLLVAEEQVGGDVEVVGEREVLVDGRDPEVGGVLRAA